MGRIAAQPKTWKASMLTGGQVGPSRSSKLRGLFVVPTPHHVNLRFCPGRHPLVCLLERVARDR